MKANLLGLSKGAEVIFLLGAEVRVTFRSYAHVRFLSMFQVSRLGAGFVCHHTGPGNPDGATRPPRPQARGASRTRTQPPSPVFISRRDKLFYFFSTRV